MCCTWLCCLLARSCGRQTFTGCIDNGPDLAKDLQAPAMQQKQSSEMMSSSKLQCHLCSANTCNRQNKNLIVIQCNTGIAVYLPLLQRFCCRKRFGVLSTCRILSSQDKRGGERLQSSSQPNLSTVVTSATFAGPSREREREVVNKVSQTRTSFDRSMQFDEVAQHGFLQHLLCRPCSSTLLARTCNCVQICLSPRWSPAQLVRVLAMPTLKLCLSAVSSCNDTPSAGR